MAEIKYTVIKIDQGKYGMGTLVEWKAVLAASTFQVFQAPAFSDASVQVDGTFDSGTVLVKGTNDRSGSNPQLLVDIFENAMTFVTSSSIKQLAQNPLVIVPSVSGGGASQTLNLRILFYSN